MIVFEIARDEDSLCGGAQSEQARRILLALHQKKRRIVQYALQKSLQHPPGTRKRAAEASEGSLRQPAINKNYGHTRAPALTKKIGPDLRLHDNHRTSLSGIERAMHGPFPVQG